jgi:hypothetical protein
MTQKTGAGLADIQTTLFDDPRPDIASKAESILDQSRYATGSKSLNEFVKECAAYDEWEQDIAHQRAQKRIGIETKLAQLQFEIQRDRETP